ncbi:DUF2341 domain-containing protein [Prolixibacteraceae bacterium JC049]|nr:DUF2341 domain-containing protein [Prolixibacteraceae bacterium JC049]
MGKVSFLLLAVLFALTTHAQNIIWSEYFDAYPNGRMIGPGLTEDTYKWKIDAGKRDASSASVQNGKLRFQSHFTSNTFYTEEIDISSFTDVSISIDYSTTGSGIFNSSALLEYVLDGATHQMANLNTSGSTTLAVSELNGQKLSIRCTVFTGTDNYRIYIDNIVVRATYSNQEKHFQGDGRLKAEYWNGIGGTRISSLKANSNYPNNPTTTEYLSSFDAPRNRGTSFGGRFTGYIVPPQTGYYNFFVASDDNSEFRISSNDDPGNLPIDANVYVDSWASYQNYWDSDCFHSSSKLLVKGNVYYFEGLYKEGGGGDHFTLAWLKPGDKSLNIIPSSALSTTNVMPLNLELSGQNISPNNWTLKATTTGGVEPYQFKLNSQSFQSGSEFYNLPDGEYTVVVRDAMGSEKSTDITLSLSTVLSVTLTAENADCGACNGSALVKISGGKPPFQVNWSGSGFADVKTKKEITFHGNEETFDYQLELNIAYENRMESDFTDIYFVSEDGNSIPHWIEKYTDSHSAVVWVKIQHVKVGDNKIEMFYGDSGYSSLNDINTVMNAEGLNVEYHNGINLSSLLYRCVDKRVLDYSFDSGQKVNVGDCTDGLFDNLSVRWTGWIKNPSSQQNIYLNIQTDDGARLYLDDMDNSIINRWYPQPATFHYSSFAFNNTIVRFKYEFFDNSGHATAQLGYSNTPVSDVGTLVPKGNYYYRNIIENPPTQIVIGHEISTQWVEEGLCKGVHQLTVTDSEDQLVSQTVTIEELTSSLQILNFDGCSNPEGNAKAVVSVNSAGNFHYQFLFNNVVIQDFGNNNQCDLESHLTEGSHVIEVVIQNLDDNACKLVEQKVVEVHKQIQTNQIMME